MQGGTKMAHNPRSNLWSNTKEFFYKEKIFKPLRQSGPHCVSTALAILAEVKPEDFQNEKVNTQDPVSWSLALQQYGMKLAYCPCDLRKIKLYMDELIEFDDLFLLCYYIPTGNTILEDPDDKGWICGSHVVIMHRDKIIDSMYGINMFAKEHSCNNHYTKRLFRVIPQEHQRGL
jgi:hypothetical protein